MEISSFDVVSAFIRKSLKNGKKFSESTVNAMVPSHSFNAESSVLIEELIFVARILEESCDKRLSRVMVERRHEMSDLMDLVADPMVVRNSYNSIMQGWLIRNSAEKMCWERVVMLIYFTSIMINHNVHRHQANCSQRIAMLTSYASYFLDKKILSWISSHGGWSGFIDSVTDIRKQSFLDIPPTSRPRSDPKLVADKSCYQIPELEDELAKLKLPAEPTVEVEEEEEEEEPEVEEEVEEIPDGPEELDHVASLKPQKKSYERPCKDLFALKNAQTYDIMLAYLKEELKVRNDVHCEITGTLDKFRENFKHRALDLEGTSLMANIITYGQIMMPHVRCDYNAVLRDWKAYTSFMLNLNSDSSLVTKAMREMLYHWLIKTDKLSWDRIVMALEFLTAIVFNLMKWHQEDSLPRILVVLEAADGIFANFVDEFIHKLGGWLEIQLEIPELKKRCKFDVPFISPCKISEFITDEDVPCSSTDMKKAFQSVTDRTREISEVKNAGLSDSDIKNLRQMTLLKRQRYFKKMSHKQLNSVRCA